MSSDELFYLGFFIYTLIGVLIFVLFTYSIGGTKNLKEPKLDFIGILFLLTIYWLPTIFIVPCIIILENLFDKQRKE